MEKYNLYMLMEKYNLYMDIAPTIATLLAVIVALFRENIRDILFSPKMDISLQDPKGEFITLSLFDSDNKYTGNQDARYYHLCVSNKKKECATDTQICLSKLEILGADNSLNTFWQGEIPMKWQDQDILNSAFKTIGPKGICDLCYVTENKELNLCTLYEKNNLKNKWNEECNFVISLYVKYKENVSQTFRFQISWDGKWEKGEIEMEQHLRIIKYK